MSSLVIAGQHLNSRLLVGTGKYRDFVLMREAIAASGAEVVTVSIRRVEAGAAGHQGLLEALDWQRLRVLPNTAGARTAQEALRLARLGRALTGSDWVKLEVIPDPTYLLPDPIDTYRAAEALLQEGFVVLPYIGPDPVLAQRLAHLGCATVMPLASPIGSGQGLKNRAMLEIFAQQRSLLPPIVVDAGLRWPSEAAGAMELGADAVLVNTAIAEAQDPVSMAAAFSQAVQAGRMAYQAGPMPERAFASPSSPAQGVPLPQPETPL